MELLFFGVATHCHSGQRLSIKRLTIAFYSWFREDLSIFATPKKAPKSTGAAGEIASETGV
jgi:hypothetical protein